MDEIGTSADINQLESLPDDQLLEFFAKFSDSEKDAIEREIMVGVTQGSDSPESFFAFYKLVTSIDAPLHVRTWIKFIYTSKSRDRGSLLWAFRGSWKTTAITVLFVAYRIGKDPEKANLIMQANDPAAQLTAAAIARIIERHPAWKLCFPNVVPDKGRGWAQNGYEVMRNDIDYGEWIAKNAARKDPTLLGLGYASGSAIGKHPDGVLSIDDIHDEGNTVSPRERQGVINITTGTILPMVVEDVTRAPGQRLVTWELVVGTPWTDDDVYHYLRSTGEFDFMMTPVMEVTPETTPDAVHFDHRDLKGWYQLAWPERFPKEIVISWFNKSSRQFWRMYMLDLEAANETGLKFHSYPHEKIDLRWPFGGGVDYASTIEIRGKVMDTKNRSKFAICWGAKLPTGGALIVDGFSGFVSQLDGEGKVEAGQGMFPNYLTTGIEMNGKGEEFFALLQRKPHLKVFPFWTGMANKRDRQERGLSPFLESGQIRISDEDTPFLNALRKALHDWPHGSMDEIDAVYAYAKTIPDALVMPSYEDGLPTYERKRKGRKPNPFSAFGSNYGPK